MAAAVLLFPAAFHLRLVKSLPGDGDVLSSAPPEIQLWFSQKPEMGLTTIRLLRPDSSKVETGPVAPADDSLAVKAKIGSALVPGRYTVTWKTASRDGHVVRGSYDFMVVPGPPARKQSGP